MRRRVYVPAILADKINELDFNEVFSRTYKPETFNLVESANFEKKRITMQLSDEVLEKASKLVKVMLPKKRVKPGKAFTIVLSAYAHEEGLLRLETTQTDNSEMHETNFADLDDRPNRESIVYSKNVPKHIKEVENLKRQISMLKDEISALYRALDQRDEEIERLKSKLVDLRTEYEDFKRNILQILNLA